MSLWQSVRRLVGLNTVRGGCRRVGPRRRRQVELLKFEILECRALLSVLTYVGPSGGSWNVATNWYDPDTMDHTGIPNGEDDAVIGATTVIIGGGPYAGAGTVTCQGTLIVTDGGTLGADSVTSNNLTVADGNMLANISVRNQFTWSATVGHHSAIGGTVNVGGSLNITGDGTKEVVFSNLSNSGIVTLSGRGDLYVAPDNGPGIINQVGATFDIESDASFILPNSGINNYGTFRKSAGRGTTQIGLAGSFNNMATGIVQVQTGTLELATDVLNEGTITPRGVGAAGSLTVTGNYTQTATGALDTAIGGPGNFGQLVIGGVATLGGTLNVGLTNGYQPHEGDSFQILTFGSRGGNSDFSVKNGLNLGNGLVFDPQYHARDLTLVVERATHFRVMPSASSVTAGTPFAVTVTALDANNNPVPGYRGTVHFTSSDGAATRPADYPFNAADNGVHTFTDVILRTVGDTGNQTITATDTVTNSITGTATVMVNPGMATHFDFSAPGSTTAGSPFSVTVTARDQFNNVATGYNGTVTLSSNDPHPATLPGPYPFNPATDHGVHTFSGLVLYTTPSQTITASGTGIGSQPKTLSVFAAAATHFRVTAPATIVAGTPFTITVTALDPFNNTDTDYDGTIFFTSSDSLAILPGLSTLNNGTRNFSVALRTAGNQTVNAIDFFHSSINGGATVSVNPAAASYFRVTAPSITTAGVAFDLMVFALDPYNNLATSYLGIVHFASSDGQASLPPNSRLTNGAGTFRVTLKTAGSQTISATDTMDSSITGSTRVAVFAAAAERFRIIAPNSTTAGSAFDLTVIAQDHYNNTAPSYRGMVHFTSSDSQAGLPANYTFTATDNGVHTFAGVILRTVGNSGNQTITATDTVTSSITGSATITVTPAAASSLTVAGFPSPTTAGNPGSFTVTAKDSYGNVTPAYTGTIHFTSTDPRAMLPPDYTFLAADHGVHTFSATLKTAGTQSLTATDTQSGTISGSQTGIMVASAAADHFQIQVPHHHRAGHAFTLAVTALDPYGNVDVHYQGTITFSSSDPNAVLPADYTFTPGDQGVATFARGASLFLAGTQTITITDAQTSRLTGNATIKITPAKADHFQIDAPATVSPSQPFDVTVTALDPYGNIDSNYLGTVTFATTDPDPGVVLPPDYTFTADDQGVHTFSGGFVLITEGDQVITATDTGSGITGSATVTVISGASPGAHSSDRTRFRDAFPGQALVLHAHDFWPVSDDALTGEPSTSTMKRSKRLPPVDLRLVDLVFTAGFEEVFMS